MQPKQRSCYAARVQKLRKRMDADGVELLLVSSLPNVHYLTGFSGSAGALLITASKARLFTDSRYDLQAHEEVLGADVTIIKGDSLAAAAKSARKARESAAAFESDAVTYATHAKLRELLPKKRLVPVSGLVESLRIEKDESEIEQIRKAVDAGSKALMDTLPHLRIGISEMEVAAEIEYRMRLHGAERPAFETIVAFGERTALPHARPGTRQLRGNECILTDLGAILGGYAGDMTRTFFMGKVPRKARDVYSAVLEAQLAGEAAARAGVECAAVDRATRKVLERRGYAQYFTHSTGHGVGREIHELPRIAPKQPLRLPEGAVITIEPGVYIPGVGGVRIEDVVVVRKHGAEVLTQVPKELTVL